MLDLCQHPEVFDELRQEMVGVLTQGGWSKAVLRRMTLLDSVIKETLRLKPISLGTWSRAQVRFTYPL